MYPDFTIQISWDIRLIVLSVIIAIIGSYVALDFAGRMKSASGQVRKFWFTGGALTMGLAIWSMHFVGMLALNMNMPVAYNEMLSIASMLAATIGSGIAFAIMNRKTIGKFHIFFGGIAMGIAIASMHYIGMASMQMAARIVYNPYLFILSVIIAIAASAGALWLAFQMRVDRPNFWFWQKTGSALVMGTAIAGMHYTGMAAASYIHIGHSTSGFTGVPIVGNFKLSDVLVLASTFWAVSLLILGAKTAGERQKLTQELERRVYERTQELQKANEELQISEARFRLLVESVKDYAIYRLDPDGCIQTWNLGAESLKGYKSNEVIGEHFSKFYTKEAIQAHYPEHELAVAKEQGQFEDEGWRVRKDGSAFWAGVLLTALYDEQGHLTGFTKITRDLTERKQREESLKQLTEVLKQQTVQLEAVNKELEAFSYSVSHDLRAPLRAIEGFSQAVYDDYIDTLDDKGKRYLTRIREGSQQMAKLINDMLNLSRLTRGELNIEEQVSLSELTKEIAAQLQQQEPERVVTFDIEDQVLVRGDRRLLQAVMWNLMDNAWKYTSKHPTATIEFGALRNGKNIYYVKDDGAGFNMQYSDKLFGAFQRLHKTSEFSGTGVGLATVARVIHRHGGEIWAEGEVEKGATFYFTLESVKVSKEHSVNALQPE